ncbi:MAG: Glycerol kinase [Firmicutes bacterium ADurb.Bin300]|nr:MAG: Glycerol kinase [Firmicutes bacterium ADurb.Bin300]
MFTIGLDIGTTNICVAMTEMETRRLVKTVTLKNDSFVVGEKPFQKMQDPEKIFGIVKKALSELMNTNTDIGAIGVTGQMHGIVYCDKSGKHVSPLFTWQDCSGNEAFMGTTYCGYINKKTGYKTASGFGLVTHFYNTLNGITPLNSYKFCTIHDYIVMRLCALKEPLVHISDAASFGIYDLVNNRFDFNSLDRLGLDSDILPNVTEKTVFAGKTNVDFLPKGIPVTVAIGDNQASFLGSVKSPPDSVLVNMGTGSQISVMTELVTCPSSGEIRPFLENTYLFVGSSLCGGRAYQILESFFKDCRVLFGLPENDDESLFPSMDKLSEKAFELSNPLLVGCEFCGTRENPDKRGVIENIGVDNFTPAHLICGVLRGTVNELFEIFESYRPYLTSQPKRLIGSGNGIRKSAVWQKLFEERFNMKLTVSENKEEAAYGASVFANKAFNNLRMCEFEL